jgi:S1/P1 Nuclease
MFKSLFSCFIIVICSYTKSFAWGAEGHAIVGRIAMQLLKNDVRQNVQSYFGTMPVDTAANWMDIMKSNSDYDFMRSWHYLDFPKNQSYIITNNDNIVNRLILTYNELSHKKILCDQQIKMDLFIMFHLMGDLHMPLHTGYEDDLGGNKSIVQYDTIKTHNLHTFWDEDIIRLTKITDADCLQYYTNAHDTLKSVDFTGWMLDSRSLLDGVYDFPDYTLNKAYLAKNKIVVQRQLLKAGVRLAFILTKLFASPPPIVDFKAITAKYKNGIDVNDALKNIGKNVTICSRVYSIRATPAITQINLGAKFPNNPVTIVVFAKDYSKFHQPLAEMLFDKNICVKGIVELYKGKPQIVVDNALNISFQ